MSHTPEQPFVHTVGELAALLTRLPQNAPLALMSGAGPDPDSRKYVYIREGQAAVEISEWPDPSPVPLFAPSPPMPTASEIASSVNTLPPLALGPLIRRINAANGWGLDFQFGDIPRYLALIHSEIVEAFNDLHRLDAFQRELGDVLVRALDLQQLVQQGTSEVADTANVLATMGADYTPEQYLLYLHGMTAATLENYRKVEVEQVARMVIMYDLLNLAQEADYFIRRQGGETRTILHSILVKNSQRGHRHGGRRA